MFKLFVSIILIVVPSVFCNPHESRVNFFNLIFGPKDGRHDCSCSKYLTLYVNKFKKNKFNKRMWNT